MYNIYFENRVLEVCDMPEVPAYGPDAVVYHFPELADLDALPELFAASPKIGHLIVPVPDGRMEEGFQRICKAYKQINAGGGLVSNAKGEYLLIFRNGCWDLPKGKQEPGEDIKTTALREVGEECGISDITAQEPICITRHCYRQDGVLILKHTHWYRMSCPDAAIPVPQREENIQQAVWIAKEKLPFYIDRTYPSIREVFEKAGLP